MDARCLRADGSSPVPRGAFAWRRHRSGTRPLTDRVKESLFAALEADGALVGPFLDLFAGSGAGGIEALSRGAPQATFVEREPKAVRVIGINLRRRTARVDSGARRLRTRRRSAILRGGVAAGKRPFGAVLVDPPYDDASSGADARAARREPSVVARRRTPSSWPSTSGATIQPERVGTLVRARQKRFGETMLSFYTRADMTTRSVPRLVRPDHVRPYRRDRPRRGDLRQADRRRPGESQEDATASISTSASRPSVRRSTRSCRHVAAQIEVAGFDGLTVDLRAAPDRCPLHRPWPARHQRLRIGAADGAHQSEALPRRRHRLLHDGARACLPELEPGQGDCLVRRRREPDDSRRRPRGGCAARPYRSTYESPRQRRGAPSDADGGDSHRHHLSHRTARDG